MGCQSRPRSFTDEGTRPLSLLSSIVSDYYRLLGEDADLTMPTAAIVALILQLKYSSSTTAMETVEIVRDQADVLMRSIPNSIPVKAGANILKIFLDQKLRQPVDPKSGMAAQQQQNESFEQAIERLKASGDVFVQRSKQARAKIADHGSREVFPESVIFTTGGSRTVRDVLLAAAARHAAELGSPRFKVVYVTDHRFPGEYAAAVAALRARDVPVAEIDPLGLAATLDSVNIDPRHRVVRFFLGAEAVCSAGHLISRLGTYQFAALAKAQRKSVVVFAETHKFVASQALHQMDLVPDGVNQSLVEFRTADAREPSWPRSSDPQVAPRDLVDWTPNRLVDRIVTEDGPMLPSGVFNLMLEMNMM